MIGEWVRWLGWVGVCVSRWIGRWVSERMGWLWVGPCDVSAVPVSGPAGIAAVILCVYTAGFFFVYGPKLLILHYC